MNKSQNPGALKSTKREVDAGALQFAAALEKVIVAPAGQSRDFQLLQVAADKFHLITGIFKQLQMEQLALLTCEIKQLLQDTLRAVSRLERGEIDLRLESAFVAASDLPALLECALRRGGDSFDLVFRLINRLRKARGCALVFTPTVLQKNEEVNFGKLFAEQPERMRALVEKQTALLQKHTALLLQDPQDERALQGVSGVFENLELISRDHRNGVIWGIARGLAELYTTASADKTSLAGCFSTLDVHAQGLLAVSEAQTGIDERGLARLLDRLAACDAIGGRVNITRLWYHLDAGPAREHKAEYRDIQVGYWSKSAVAKCLLLVSEDCRNLLDVINELAEETSPGREKVREVFQAIRKSSDVMRMLGLSHLVQLIEASLPAVPGEVLEEALRQAATLLHRINSELDSKLARMEREVVGTANALGQWERINASQARLLQNAMQILDTVMVAVNQWAQADAAEPVNLRSAREKLALLADVLGTVHMTEQSQQLATGCAWLDWLLDQPTTDSCGEPMRTLLALLTNNRDLIELLLYGQAASAASVELSAALATALAAHLQALRTAAAAVTGTQLMIVPVMPATNDEVTERLQPEIEAAAPAPADPVPVTATIVPREAVDEALLAVFLEEADELLQLMNSLYLRWSAAPSDKTCLDEYLRALHTIKGSAALVCEHAMSELAHEYETFILDERQRKRSFDAAFFQSCDERLHALHDVVNLYQRNAAGHIVRSSAEPQTTAQQPEPVLPPQAAAQVSPPVTQLAAERATEPAQAQAPDELIRVSGKLLESLLNDADEISFSRSRVETGINDMAALLLELDASLNRFHHCVAALDHHSSSQASARASSPFPANAGGRHDEFDALELDRYTVLQELAVSLAENVNDLQDVRSNFGSRIKENLQVLAGQQRLTNTLQDGLILTQMVPFASVVPRLKRLVRQISSVLGKPVRLDVENRQGSVDRSILQALITPLEHIIRNAIDHGIESPELRRQLGKPEEATVRITVQRCGASVRIEIRDDGQGVDVEKIRQRAVRSGLLADDVVINEADAHRLLFQGGFTTAEAVSSISGRGVGLDVVKSEIAQIGGTVEIESVPGKWTAFALTLPLTSSLNRALVFALHDTRYVVLMNTLDGVIVDRLGNIHRKQQEGQPVYDYGGRQYQYLYLGKLISDDLKPRLESIDSSASLLLVSGGSGNFALHIDAVIESRDLVVKTLGQQFASMPGIAGGVILPDGNVAIVLDLKAMTGSLEHGKPVSPALPQLSSRRSVQRQRKLVMVVDDSVTVRKVTSAMLKRNGMDVITAKNGVEAVELLETTLPDLILLDIEMPQMDGFEVASFVRSHDGPVRDIPIIMITSRIGDKHRSRAAAIGVNEYLCKPFKEDSLLASILEY